MHTKNELKLQYSQASITSEDKAVQYPSEDELKGPIKTCLQLQRVHDLERPRKVKDNAIIVSDISLSDDELQIQMYLPSSDGKKENSSRNSSYNSIPGADRSSISSISSYEPSERFYRRTKAVEDDDKSVADADASEPMSYKRHVARLAERALRACTNYYSECIKLKPDLDQELNRKVEMLYNSEMRFNTCSNRL
ncbi:hypothetical protein KR044_005694 [Drosophila immigrans]|nr:hypothetical protein KR044_005694 [Drosophila immigrans]